jgi:hypothetical protein
MNVNLSDVNHNTVMKQQMCRASDSSVQCGTTRNDKNNDSITVIAKTTGKAWTPTMQTVALHSIHRKRHSKRCKVAQTARDWILII